MTKQVVVLRVTMDGQKNSFCCVMGGHEARTKAMKIAVSVRGVEEASLKGPEKDQIEVKGEGIDTVELTTLIRKKVGHADIVSVKEDKKEDKKAEVVPLMVCQPYPMPSYPIYHHEEPCASCSIM